MEPCGKDDLREKFRKLTPNLLSKAVQSPAALNSKAELHLNNQLYHKHYTDFVVFDRNLSPNNKREFKLNSIHKVGKKNTKGENSNEQFNTENCYQSGLDISKDKERAFEWCFKSAKSGNSNGQLFVGNCYQHGISISKDEKKHLNGTCNLQRVKILMDN